MILPNLRPKRRHRSKEDPRDQLFPPELIRSARTAGVDVRRRLRAADCGLEQTEFFGTCRRCLAIISVSVGAKGVERSGLLDFGDSVTHRRCKGQVEFWK